MKYQTAPSAVPEQDVSGSYRTDVLGLEALADIGATVTKEGGISLTKTDTWKTYVQRLDDDIVCGTEMPAIFDEEAEDPEAYFDDYDELSTEIDNQIRNGLSRIDISTGDGRNIIPLIQELLDKGLSLSDIAGRMNVTTAYLKSCLN